MLHVSGLTDQVIKLGWQKLKMLRKSLGDSSFPLHLSEAVEVN